MDHRAVEQAKLRLAKAATSAELVRTATTLEASEEAWTDYLVAVSAIYSKLEQGAKNSPKSRQWFGRKKKERRGDPLLRYLHAARNSNEHGIERVVEQTGPNQDLTGRKLSVNERVLTEFEFIDQNTLQPTSERHKGVLAGPTLRAIRAHDDRFGDYCDPPRTHLGEEIDFADFADSLANAALPYLRSLVAEAEALAS